MSVDRGGPKYEHLRALIKHYEDTGCNWKELIASISKDQSVDWNHIRINESQFKEWDQMKIGYKEKLIQKLCTCGRFRHGGDRRSAAVRGAKQCALIEYTRELALQRPLEDDDHAVSDEVVDVVAARFRGTTAAATVRLRSIVRCVTRRVRIRQRNPGAGVANDTDDEEETVLSEENIEEVTMWPATGTCAAPSSLSTYIDPHALGGLSLEVIDRLVELRRIEAPVELKRQDAEVRCVEAAVETKRMEVDLETKRIEAELETKRINAPADLVRAQTEQLRVTTTAQRAAEAGKRTRTTDNNAAAELDRIVAATWCNMWSLPAVAQLTVPLGMDVPPTRELCAAVQAWAKSTAAAVKHRVRIAPRIVPGLSVVYIKADDESAAAAIARRFWADRAAVVVAAAGCDVVSSPVPTTVATVNTAAAGCEAPPPIVPPPSTDASMGDGAETVVSTPLPAAAPPLRMLYDRAVVLGDIAIMQGCGALPAPIASALAADAGLPYFAADPPDAPWKANRCEMRALRSLYGLDGACRLSDADNGAIVTIAKRLPGWDKTWMERRCSSSGRQLPMRYAAGAAMSHLKRAAELVAALRADGLFATPAEASDAVTAMVERLMR